MERLRGVITLALAAVLVRGGLAAEPGMPPDPEAAAVGDMDRVRLRDGRTYEGLIEKDDEGISLFQVRRPKGRAMYVLVRHFDTAAVASTTPMDNEAERAKLRDLIEQFRNRAAIEAGRMEAVVLTPVVEDGSRRQRYQGKWFTLDSTADETTTRRVIVRTEQIFAAYRQMLPPRVNPERPLRLVVFGSMQDYRDFLRRLGLRIRNQACFVEQKNLVAVGSELGRLGAQMAWVNQRHRQIRNELEQLKTEQLPRRLREIARQMQRERRPQSEIQQALAKTRGEFAKEMQRKIKQIGDFDRANAKMFDESTRQMFTRLYHESFHAYLENFVYPAGRHDVPHWLNEGLAVMFEGGILETGAESSALRIDVPNPAALKELQADLGGDDPLPLEKLLAAGPAEFLVAPDAAPGSANRYYSHAWGLVYDLAFEKRLLSGPALDRYVQADAAKLSPAARFQKLVGVPPGEFEKQWRQYIPSLPPCRRN